MMTSETSGHFRQKFFEEKHWKKRDAARNEVLIPLGAVR